MYYDQKFAGEIWSTGGGGLVEIAIIIKPEYQGKNIATYGTNISLKNVLKII